MPLKPASTSQRVRITRYRDHRVHAVQDHLAVEEPLEIRLAIQETDICQIQPIAVTMRTPGMDESLALGFLFSEGVLHTPDEVVAVRRPNDDLAKTEKSPHEIDQTACNRIDIVIRTQVDTRSLSRHVFTSSSCGICGKQTIEQVLERLPQQPNSQACPVPASQLHCLPETLRHAQETFHQTGGLHAAALFAADGTLIQLCEDVGRHNALDKLIGEQFRQGHLPLHHTLLLLSGRASFELVQKAAMAGIPAIAAIGAPSSLAVQCAQSMGITLIGFLKRDGFNVYTGSFAAT